MNVGVITQLMVSCDLVLMEKVKWQKRWKDCIEFKGLKVNVHKTNTMISYEDVDTAITRGVWS